MAQGTSGNAARYVTRNQALKKLQLHLGEFRCREYAWPACKHCFAQANNRAAELAAHLPPCDMQAPVHPQGHPPPRAKQEDAGTEQDLLPCEGPGFLGTRAAYSQAQVLPHLAVGTASVLWPSQVHLQLLARRSIAAPAMLTGSSMRTRRRSARPRPSAMQTWPSSWLRGGPRTHWIG